jgi:peptidoglycan/xylan/chitin deacetylase (PgdA/CDA1 family)
MRLFRPGFLTIRLFPEALFRIKTEEKVLYLTFDDGPDIISTISLLKILSDSEIKATFFCSGKAASENPALISRMKTEGHVVGNHGYNHLDGLLTSKKKYLTDIRKASEFTSDCLFRPPYGRMRFNQYLNIKKSFRIIMWDIMPYDFDRKFGAKKSITILKKMIRPGSVIVLHDTSRSCALEILPEFLKFAIKEGYQFCIPD